MYFTVEHPLGQHGCAPELYDAPGVARLPQPPNSMGSTRLPSPSIRPRRGRGSIRVATPAWTR